HWVAALADRFKPGSTRGYAFLVLAADIFAIFFLLMALRALRQPLSRVLAYAWCPVLLKELYCTLVVDAFVLAGLAAVVWFLVAGRRVWLALPLAVCAALRPAMLLLVPPSLKRIGVFGLVIVAVLVAVPLLPFLDGSVPPDSYVQGNLYLWAHYEYNSFFENLGRWVLRLTPMRAEQSLTVAGVELLQPGEKLGPLLAKLAGIIALLGVVSFATIRPATPSGVSKSVREGALHDLFIVLVALLVFTPILHPWHALWLLPILVVRPAISWLALPGLVSLSYLTHLHGPAAADLAFPRGGLSFRVVEFGLFGTLWALDMLWRPVLFRHETVLAPRPMPVITTEDMEFAQPEPEVPADAAPAHE
ncbi:MAG: hypothetical protein ACREID_02940, partial [Planctomycetota bacterium]